MEWNGIKDTNHAHSMNICIHYSIILQTICLHTYLQDIFSGSTHLSDSSTLILERVDRHHAGVYQCAADNGVREPVSMDINLTILCEFCSMADDKFPIELPYSDSIVLQLLLFFFGDVIRFVWFYFVL